MKPERGTIAIHFVQEAVRGLAPRGLDAADFLARAGIPPAFLSEPLARVSPQQFGLLWRDVARALDDEFFGLDRHPARVGSYALMCASALGSADLSQALRRSLHFMSLVLDDLRGELVVEGERVTIRLHDRNAGKAANGRPQPLHSRLFAHATYLIMVYGLACWLVGRRIALLEGQFACPEPAGAGVPSEYRVLFCEALRFDADATTLVFARSYLTLPVVQTAASLREFLRGAPANFLVKYRDPKSLAARIRRRLRERVVGEWPAFEQFCAELHLSEATLRRRLRDEGHTYQSIKDDLRRDQAIALLQGSRRSLPDIATTLGFAEPSAFHRAFKKWTGARPSDYRAG
jgi:AraC-like DNA-binding protein